MLGAEKARRLEARGAAGEAAAALVAATAPQRPPAGTGPAAGAGGPGAPLPDGGSGLGEILGQATGLSTDGGLGPVLPVAILAVALWAIAYLRRSRRPAG